MNLLSLILIISILGCKLKEGENQTLNGFEAYEEEFNYHVSIFARGGYECGGGIIDSNHVITAAHCIAKYEEYEIIILAGVGNLTDNSRVLRTVKKFHIPADFHFNRRNNDIAVIRLYTPFVFGEKIQAMRLPSLPVTDDNKVCWFTGMDMNRIGDAKWTLSWIPLELIAAFACECVGGFELPSRVFCALDITEETRPTPGDSGGILICDGIAVGVLCGRLENDYFSPNIFASIYKNLDFIDIVLGLTADDKTLNFNKTG